MKTWRTSAVAAAALAAALAGGVLAAQDRDAPESLLPPGFGDPEPAQPAPATPPRARPTATPGAPSVPGAPPPPLTIQPLPGVTPVPSPTPSPSPTPTPLTAAELLRYEMPEYARRSTARVGGIDATSGGLSADAFGDADGVFIERLMRRIDAPIASRWLSIALRRMLMSRIDTPVRVNGADFAAERAWLLIRMGEAAAARSVVQAVDLQDHTPKLYQVAMQAALATGDPAALCPLEPFASETSTEAAWRLVAAMCAGLSGEPRRAGTLIDAARRQRVARGTDLLLAEKVLGAGAQGRRAVTIEWDDVQQLTAWRYGLAAATGVAIPDALLATVGPHVLSWQALSPALPPESRLRAAETAASFGVLSNAALVDLWGAVEEADAATSTDASIARDLRTAYTAATAGERVTVMRQLWTEPTDARIRHARRILTARAATRIVPSVDLVGDADALVASMLSAGLDMPAARWRGIAPDNGDAWAMIVLTDPQARGAVSAGTVNGYRGGASERKAQLFVAAMAGLGRVEPDGVQGLAQAVDLGIGDQNAWTRAIARAASERQPAMVVLLAAAGMQTTEWSRVDARALFHIIAALTAVGLEGEARMIAAEAIARA